MEPGGDVPYIGPPKGMVILQLGHGSTGRCRCSCAASRPARNPARSLTRCGVGRWGTSRPRTTTRTARPPSRSRPPGLRRTESSVTARCVPLRAAPGTRRCGPARVAVARARPDEWRRRRGQVGPEALRELVRESPVARRRKEEAAAAVEAEASSGALRPARGPRARPCSWPGLHRSFAIFEWARHLYSNACSVVVCTLSAG
jgi:hypothetical protein